MAPTSRSISLDPLPFFASLTNAASWNPMLTQLVRTGRGTQLETVKGKLRDAGKTEMDNRDIATAGTEGRLATVSRTETLGQV